MKRMNVQQWQWRTEREARLLFNVENPSTPPPQPENVDKLAKNLWMREDAEGDEAWKNRHAYDRVQDRITQYTGRMQKLYSMLIKSDAANKAKYEKQQETDIAFTEQPTKTKKEYFQKNMSTHTQDEIDRQSKLRGYAVRPGQRVMRIHWFVRRLEEHYLAVEKRIAAVEKQVGEGAGPSLHATMWQENMKTLQQQFEMNGSNPNRLQTIHIDQYIRRGKNINMVMPARMGYLLRLPLGVQVEFQTDRGTFQHGRQIPLSGGYQYIAFDTRFVDSLNTRTTRVHINRRDGTRLREGGIRRDEYGNLVFLFGEHNENSIPHGEEKYMQALQKSIRQSGYKRYPHLLAGKGGESWKQLTKALGGSLSGVGASDLQKLFGGLRLPAMGDWNEWYDSGAGSQPRKNAGQAKKATPELKKGIKTKNEKKRQLFPIIQKKLTKNQMEELKTFPTTIQIGTHIPTQHLPRIPGLEMTMRRTSGSPSIVLRTTEGGALEVVRVEGSAGATVEDNMIRSKGFNMIVGRNGQICALPGEEASIAGRYSFTLPDGSVRTVDMTAPANNNPQNLEVAPGFIIPSHVVFPSTEPVAPGDFLNPPVRFPLLGISPTEHVTIYAPGVDPENVGKNIQNALRISQDTRGNIVFQTLQNGEYRDSSPPGRVGNLTISVDGTVTRSEGAFPDTFTIIGQNGRFQFAVSQEA